MYRELINASKKTGVPTKKVLDLVYILFMESQIQLQNIYKKTGLSKSSVTALIQHLPSLLILGRQNLELSEIGKKETQKLIEENYLSEEQQFSFFNREIYTEIIDTLEKAKTFRSNPNRNFDQFYATEETTAKRAILMDFMADVKNKKILLLGDDDMLSVALGKLKKADEIEVLDIDENILSPIEKVAKIEGLKISTNIYNANQQLPKNFRNQFDIVFTDPPYTKIGIELFLSRAIEALDATNHNARIYLCYGNSDRAKEKYLIVQEAIFKSGLYLRWLFDKFNRYTGAESIGSTSSIYILEKTQKTKPIITGENKLDLYTNQ